MSTPEYFADAQRHTGVVVTPVQNTDLDDFIETSSEQVGWLETLLPFNAPWGDAAVFHLPAVPDYDTCVRMIIEGPDGFNIDSLEVFTKEGSDESLVVLTFWGIVLSTQPPGSEGKLVCADTYAEFMHGELLVLTSKQFYLTSLMPLDIQAYIYLRTIEGSETLPDEPSSSEPLPRDQ